jgi:hypothetical protein
VVEHYHTRQAPVFENFANELGTFAVRHSTFPGWPR